MQQRETRRLEEHACAGSKDKRKMHGEPEADAKKITALRNGHSATHLRHQNSAAAPYSTTPAQEQDQRADVSKRCRR